MPPLATVVTDPALSSAIASASKLPHVTKVAPAGRWTSNPHHRLPAGTLVVQRGDKFGLIVKGYTQHPYRGFIPLLIVTTLPEQVAQSLEAANRARGETLKAARIASEAAELPAPVPVAVQPPSVFSSSEQAPVAPVTSVLLTTAEAAARLGLKRSTSLHDYVRSGRLTPAGTRHARGGGHLFAPADIERLLHARTLPTAPVLRGGSPQLAALHRIEQLLTQLLKVWS